MKKKPPPVYMCTHYTLKVPKKRSLASIISFPPPCAAISLHLRFTDHSPQPCASLLRLAHIVFFPIYLFIYFTFSKARNIQSQNQMVSFSKSSMEVGCSNLLFIFGEVYFKAILGVYVQNFC